jgi:hypothetical protein
MKRTLCTTAAAALLASVAIFASFEDAQARGFGRGGGAGIHRMGGRAHLQSNHVNRAQHFARGSIRPHGNARLRNANRPGIRQAATKEAAGATARSSNLNYGPQNDQARVYRQMGMGNTPQANNTPPTTNGGSSQPQNNAKPGPVANGSKNLPKDHLIGQGKIPVWISKPVDWGITRVIPVYGPVKTVYETYQVKPKIEQTLENSALSNKLHEEKIKAEEEAAKARRDQGGGVFQPSGLHDPSLMDP